MVHLQIQISSEELLDVTQGGCCHAVIINQPEIQSDSETTEIELGAGIVVNRRIYLDIFDLDHVKKFTKSLAVVIWGSCPIKSKSAPHTRTVGCDIRSNERISYKKRQNR
ncbi:hypothetical protein JTE90_015216 [Oedothorax gibbosus]|uniref:Uncharacterized protein n=1 Tax=Oedothorax gibbosus TaxID=931172 RepID=A0AAV6V7K4_9ARAC|nr:hypothetical protein JTE90_015216 [Oedothorax gibbosus]